MKSIAEKLLALERRDQEMRKGGRWDGRVDERNIAELKKVVEEIGWPTISRVGVSASRAGWLVALHADSDIPFQERCWTLMRQESASEVAPDQVAYMTDRVRVNRGRKQIYGTQFYTDEDGVYGPRPIEDLPNLDKRREKVGLGPFAEYKAKMLKKHLEKIPF